MRGLLSSCVFASGVLLTLGCDVAAVNSGSNSPIAATDDSWQRPAGPTPVEAHGQLAVSGLDLIDQSGMPVQLKGVSSMWLNWEDDGYAENPDALIWMRDHWNLSLIRAAMGVTPKGAYLDDPDKAKQQVTTIVDNAIAAGVYVIIDWHDSSAEKRQDEAVAFFTEMASKYAGVPNVIYETYNEPSNVAWASVLKPYHEAVVAGIRSVEPNSVIILGTGNYSQNVDEAAGAPLDGANLMYTLHFYSCTHGGWLITKARSALSRGLPLFVTEWGATNADGGLDGKVCVDVATQWLEFLNPAHISWAAWKLDNCTPDSTCLLSAAAPLNGGWTSEYLHGHATFVRDALRQQ